MDITTRQHFLVPWGIQIIGAILLAVVWVLSQVQLFYFRAALSLRRLCPPLHHRYDLDLEAKMAPSLKRKREYTGDGGDDDDDAIYGLRQTLPVANLPIDFDSEPMDGMQYLFTVRYVPSTLVETYKDSITSHPQARCKETTRCQARRQSLRLQPTTAC